MNVTKIPKKTISVIEPKRSLIVNREQYHQRRVAAYCRVSTDSEEQLTSYTNQKKVYTEMIAAKPEWEFAGLYADEGISGTRADKRPQFQKMINDCLSGKIDYIITKSVSRFARNTVDCLDHVRMLRARGIGIYFEEQNIDTLQIDSELYLVIYAGFAQSESESISKNVTWTFRKRFQEGKPIFNYKCLLGYRKGADGEPEIVPEEASIVERIFNMYLSGETINRISTKLREENLQIPGKRFSFSASMIKGILRNERYCGDSILQKTVTIDCIGKVRRKNTGEAPMYYVQNSHVGIISRELFHKTQEELARRMSREPNSTKTATTATGKYSRYALSNVMICAECGSRYKRVTWTSRGKKRVVWRCISRLDYGKRYCKTSLTVDEDRTLAFCESVWEELFELFPYEYVHMGGDEVDKSNWKRCPDCQTRMRAEGLPDEAALQAWFMHRMQRFCEARGRRMIGWDEILEGGAVPGATVMWWRPWEPQSVSAATRQGCEVVLCPQSWFYFSLEEDANSLARICRFDMLPDSLSDAQKRQIKGVQGNLWTEKIPTWSRAEYMFYPRLLVLAEKGWTEPGKFDEDAFMSRLLDYCRRLDDEGVNYRIPSLTNYHAVSVFTDSVRTAVVCPLPGAVLRYTLDGSVPTVNSPRYDAPLVIRDDCMLHIRPYHADGRTGDWITVRYEKQDYARPLEPRDTEPGLCVDWYFRRFPGCDAIGIPETLYAAGGRCVVDSVCFPRAAAGRRAVGMIFRGYIDIPATGIYTFALASDDGAILRIGGRVVVDNDGEHPLLEKSGQVALSAGLHPLELRYFDYNGGEIRLVLLGDDGARHPLDTDLLRHDP